MACHVVAHPDQDNWLGDIPTSDDKEEGHVPYPDADSHHIEQNDISNGREKATSKDKARAMLRLVARDSSNKRAHGCEQKDRDRHDLSPDRRPAKLFEDSWGEEGAGVAGSDDTHVHQDTIMVSKKLHS